MSGKRKSNENFVIFRSAPVRKLSFCVPIWLSWHGGQATSPFVRSTTRHVPVVGRNHTFVMYRVTRCSGLLGTVPNFNTLSRFNVCPKNCPGFPKMSQIVMAIGIFSTLSLYNCLFKIPESTNTATKKIFSIINNIWTSEKSQLKSQNSESDGYCHM